MQQATGRRERSNAKIIGIVCAALLVLTYVLSQFNTWSRKPADAGECSSNDAAWRQTALKNKLAGTDSASAKSQPFAVLDGSHWDSKDHLWIVPFSTSTQEAGAKNFVALIHCTGSVDIRAGNQ